MNNDPIIAKINSNNPANHPLLLPAAIIIQTINRIFNIVGINQIPIVIVIIFLSLLVPLFHHRNISC